MNDDLNLKEKNKYIQLYTDIDNYYKNNWSNGYSGYGQVNHGKNANTDLLSFNPNSLLDVGCGDGKFCIQAFNLGIKYVYGIDIASVATNSTIPHPNIKYFDGFSHSLPFEDNFVDVITSFDVLEHCLEKDIKKTVLEFHRVCIKGLVLKISYRQATENFKGVPVHMTVKPEIWWIREFSNKFNCSVSKYGYIICKKLQ